MSKPNRFIRLAMSATVSLILLGSFFLPARSASAAEEWNLKLPYAFVRVANCTGETVLIEGTIHLIYNVQPNGSTISHFNYQEAHAVGLTSGVSYQVSGTNQNHLKAPIPSNIQYIDNFRLISQGAASNLLVKVLFHITVNANGEMTVSIDKFDMECT